MFLRALGLSVACSGACLAQDADVRVGRDLYLTHCWQCHGQDAKGTGPMAEVLAIAPPDLTGLALRNAGVFPTEAVARQIDGRDALLAHGGDMPLFGPMLDSVKMVALRLPSGQLMMTGVPLASVIVYLESVQRK